MGARLDLRRQHMKRLVVRSLVLSALCTLSVLAIDGIALAHGFHHGWGHGHHWGHAPEIDPNLIGSGLALLGGSLMVIVERYRRR